MQKIDLSGRVAIVTGAGGGLGRTHALMLARRGAKVLVNDLGGARDGSGSGLAAREVAEEICAAGGEAIASTASVTDFTAVEKMVAEAMDRWDRIDILVNNAGVLRDRTFARMDVADFRFVVEVHLMGAVNCTKAVWEIMRTQSYGRIVFTTSSSGLYGNFGQSNYGAAKLALVGLMQTLGLEGAKYGIRVNCLAPSAATRMTEDILSAERLEVLRPERVSDGLPMLVGDNAPNRVILCAGGGSFERAYITLTKGAFIPENDDASDEVARLFDQMSDRAGEMIPNTGADQSIYEVAAARSAFVDV